MEKGSCGGIDGENFCGKRWERGPSRLEWTHGCKPKEEEELRKAGK